MNKSRKSIIWENELHFGHKQSSEIAIYDLLFVRIPILYFLMDDNFPGKISRICTSLSS